MHVNTAGEEDLSPTGTTNADECTGSDGLMQAERSHTQLWQGSNSNTSSLISRQQGKHWRTTHEGSRNQ